MGAALKPDWRGWKPVDISDEFLGELTKRIKQGATPELAAEAIGVPRRKFRKWMAEGEEDVLEAFETGERGYALTRFGTLFLAVGMARGDLAVELAKRVKNDDLPSRGAQWLLERLERDDYGNAEKVDVDVTVEGVVAVEGRAVVGIGDVLRFLHDAGQDHALDIGPGAARRALPAARDVLPDPAGDQPAASGVPAD